MVRSSKKHRGKVGVGHDLEDTEGIQRRKENDSLCLC